MDTHNGRSPTIRDVQDPASGKLGIDAENDRLNVDRAVDQAKSGDSAAIRFLYLRYSEDVHRFVRSIVVDEHDAEDVTQTVFMKVIRMIRKYRGDSVPFVAWLIRVARNAAIDHLRERRPIPYEEIRTSTPDPQAANLERLTAIREAIAGIQLEQRQVVLLRQVCGLSPGEIAARLGKSEGAVHGLHHRGRRAAQARLRERGAQPVTR